MNTVIIEIVLGLVLTYSLLSLIASQAVEALRGMSNFRTRYLVTWLADNLTYDATPDRCTKVNNQLRRQQTKRPVNLMGCLGSFINAVTASVTPGMRSQSGGAMPTAAQPPLALPAESVEGSPAPDTPAQPATTPRPTVVMKRAGKNEVTEFADRILSHPLIALELEDVKRVRWWNLIAHLRSILREIRILLGGTVWLHTKAQSDYVDVPTMTRVVLEELRKYVRDARPDLPDTLSDAELVDHLRDITRTRQGAVGYDTADGYDDAWAMAEGMQIPPRLVGVLERLLQVTDRVEGSVNAALQPVTTLGDRLQDWFQRQEEDMRRIFQRNTFWWTGLVGLFFAVALNVDSIGMAKLLWEDPLLRESVAEAAVQIVEDRDAELAAADATLDTDTGTESATGTETGTDTAADTGDDSDGVDDTDDNDGANGGEEGTALADLEQSIDQLVASGLPIGWVWEDLDDADDFDPGESRNLYHVFGTDVAFVDRLWFIVQKAGGLLVTALAVSLGSDFWFNVLRNLSGRGRND
jgi:hypothetical protein